MLYNFKIFTIIITPNNCYKLYFFFNTNILKEIKLSPKFVGRGSPFSKSPWFRHSATAVTHLYALCFSDTRSPCRDNHQPDIWWTSTNVLIFIFNLIYRFLILENFVYIMQVNINNIITNWVKIEKWNSIWEKENSFYLFKSPRTL